MATAGNVKGSQINLKYNVTCGVLEEGKSITLTYKVPDPKDQITWKWIPQQSEDGTVTGHVAQMNALESKRGHESRPIPDSIHKKLGSKQSKSRDGSYYKVKMSRSDNVSIEQYFNTS